MSPRPAFDLIVFGATSFVGRILCRHLLERQGAAGGMRWALAGRSQPRLAALREELGTGAAALPILLADASEAATLRAMCERTRAVVSTVGPYALHGEPLVEACAAAGTDYADLTGEVQWIRRMIERHETAARASGARIVHCCGFDSIPSDLGVHFLQREATRRFGEPCERVKMRVKSVRGGISGGTAASMLNLVAEATKHPSLLAELANPYSLCPRGGPKRPRQPEVRVARYDGDFRAWVAPFLMGAINTRIVHRTNALAGDAYGASFRYDEAMITGRGVTGGLAAGALTAGMGGFALAGALPPSRWALQRFVLPAPGEGPSERAQANGMFDLRFHGRTSSGRTLRVKVTGDRDPGYGSTAKMLGEAAALLATGLPRGTPAGGFWTPATAFGDALVERLREHAGVTFDVIDD